MAATRAIHLQTEVPGPRSRAIVERKERVIAKPMSLYLPIVAAEGRGSTLTDVDGNTYIDFTGGVGCLNVGHAHPKVVEAVQEQAARFLHTDFTMIPYEVGVTLAERLLAVAPFTGPAKAAFFNAGTEAVENAVKFARAYTGRPALIAFEGGFHGRTLLSLSLTSKTHPVAAENVAAIVLEPVQGEAGFVVAPPEFITGVRAICDRHGIVLIVDEVQTGFGRTGRMFGIEHYGVEPDLITVAKSIAAGLPLSGVLGKAEIMDAPGDSAVGGTFVGNPVAQAAALAVLDVFEDEGLVDRAERIGETIHGRMLGWQERHPQIGDVRGLGAMLALEYVRNPTTKEPAPELATQVAEAAAQRGLLLLKAGTYSNCNRVLCPLVITDSELDEALAAWEEALCGAPLRVCPCPESNAR